MKLEDRVRSATKAVAGEVHRVRPLVLPDAQEEEQAWQDAQAWASFRRRRRLRLRLRIGMAPVAAAAAVIAIAVSLVIVKDARNSHPAPVTRAGVPEYYVALNDSQSYKHPDQAVVGETFTGKRLATVNSPAQSSFVGVAAAADDRTFVLGAQQFPYSATWWPVEPRTWYLLRIAPGTDHPASLTRLRIPATPFGLEVNGMALSPDGSKLALALEPNDSETTGPETLRIYSVASGALLRIWTGQPSNVTWDISLGGDNNTTLSWLADRHTVVFDYGNGIRTLDTSRPGHDLIADSRPIAWSTGGSFDTCGRPVVTPDGKSVVCATQVTGAPVGKPCSGAFVEHSTATGKLTRTLYRTRCGSYGEVLWASRSGDMLIGQLNPPFSERNPPPAEVGVITQGHFKPLSFPLSSRIPLPNDIAW
jgi:hypothetical protein